VTLPRRPADSRSVSLNHRLRPRRLGSALASAALSAVFPQSALLDVGWPATIGELRAQFFYDVDRDGDKVVVVAIGRKSHNRLRIGDEEIEL
jgi:hypothetical protein